MFWGNENAHILVRVTGKDLADFVESFARYHDFPLSVFFFQLNLTDGDPVPVQGHYFQFAALNFKEFSTH